MTGNPIEDLRVVLSYHFMVNALRAGTIVAVVAGLIGYLMVQRRQSYAGHTLAVIGFPGAAGATWLGLNPAFGYFGFCLAGALVIASLPGSGRVSGPGGVESAGIGTVQAFALACGLLFVSLYRGFQSGLNNLLFGAITGVSDGQVVVLLCAGVLGVVALGLLGRPLLFASVDPRVAEAAGVPVRWLNLVFLLLLGTATAGASQITGSLLVFALLVAPASAAIRLTARPSVAAALSVLIALAVTWTGEVVAFFSPYPIGFWVTTFGFAVFLLASGYRVLVERGRWRSRAAVGATS